MAGEIDRQRKGKRYKRTKQIDKLLDKVKKDDRCTDRQTYIHTKADGLIFRHMDIYTDTWTKRQTGEGMVRQMNR